MGKSSKIVSERAVIIEHLTKQFTVNDRERGLFGSARSLFKPKKRLINALIDVSCTISEGEIVGIIGPNGAGKTTTVNILSGLLYPSSGFVNVLGYGPWKRKPDFLKKIALVLGQKYQLWWNLPAKNTLLLNKAIYEIPDKKYNDTLEELTTLLEVRDLLEVPVCELSLGQRTRLELVVALIHQPKVLFLDEPTKELDVVEKQKIRDFLYDYNRRFKVTVLLTSHDLDDLINVTKRVIAIDRGEILFDGLLKELTDLYVREKLIKVYLSKAADFKRFEKIGKVKRIEFPEVVLTVAREVAPLAAAEILQNFPVVNLTIEEEPIEEIIKRVFRGDKAKKKVKKTL